MANRSRPVLLRAGLAMLLAAQLVGCGITGAAVGAQSWTVGSTDDVGNTISVDVTDRSGVVSDVALDPPDADQGLGVAAVADSLDTYDVSWFGNGCDQHAAIDIESAGAGIGIRVRVAPSTVPCDGSIVRTLRLKLRKPVPPAMVVFHRDPGA